MALIRHRRDRIDRIEGRVARLHKRAARLLEREGKARSDRRLQKLRARRERLVEGEVRAILVGLQEQAQRTRLRLDRELSRLAPIEREWERLGQVFDELDSVLGEPAVEQLGSRWRGGLEIPEFPVREREEYIKPFPPGAIVF